jgi:hypothetical protein
VEACDRLIGVFMWRRGDDRSGATGRVEALFDRRPGAQPRPTSALERDGIRVDRASELDIRSPPASCVPLTAAPAVPDEKQAGPIGAAERSCTTHTLSV